METSDLLKELTEASGPSGYEAEVAELVAERLAALAEEVKRDRIGNVVALRRGEGGDPRPSVMLAAHMDEISLMVAGLEKGFLRLTEVGGFDKRNLLGQEVRVHGRRELPGLVVSVPPHFTEPAEREKPVPLDKLFVDVGLPASEVEALVRVGDPIIVKAPYVPLAGGCASSKSMDDRASVAAVILCLEELCRRRHLWDVYAVATVQEEVTGIGAIAGAYSLRPTIAVAIDVTFGQQPGFSSPETGKLDGGPCVSLGPNVHPGMFERLVDAAKALEIPYQLEPVPGSSGTDAWPIQVSRSGIPTGLLGIPLRYMHSAVETVSLRDVERTARLLAEFVSRLDAGFADALSVKDALAREADGKES
jgi:putative aminopeptidase FrvX